MPVRRGVPSVVVPVLVLIALAVGAPSASAVSLDKVTGGQTAMFVPLSNVQQLGQERIFVGPIAPAFLTFNSLQEGPAIRFPISGGAVESSTMLGTVDHAGGMVIMKFNPDDTIATQLEVTDIRIVNGNMMVGNALGLVPTPTADLVNASHSRDASSGAIHFEADARLNVVTATVLNTYFSTDVFKDGMVLGRVKSDITTEQILGL
jgi:hypothetical protein